MIRTSIGRRSKPRRGRERDEKFLQWVRTLPSIVPTHDPKCRGCRVTANHVRSCKGKPKLDRQKNDRRVVPLHACRHMQGFGDATYEHGGKEAFEQRFNVDLEQIMARQVIEYEKQKARKVA